MAELDEVKEEIESFRVVKENKTLDDEIDKFEKELSPIKEKDFIKYVRMDEEEEKDIRLMQDSLGSGITVKRSDVKVKKGSKKKDEEQDWAEVVREDVLFPGKKESAYAGDVSKQYKDGSGPEGSYTSHSDDSIQGYSSSKYQ
jgi:hypothetical protein